VTPGESASSAEAPPRAANRAAFDHLSALLRLTPKPAWATPALIALGLATSLAETLGITLIVAFLYAALGQTGDVAAAAGGLLGQALNRARAVFGSSAQMALGILVLILTRAALAYANRAISAQVGERISEAARNRIHKQYLTLPYGFVQQHEQAQLMEVLGTESWLIAGAYSSLTRILVGACSIVVFGAFLLALSWQITLTAVVGSIGLSMVLHRLARPAQMLGQRVKRVHQALGEHMLMTIEGLRTIRAYGQEGAHQERFVRASAEARATSLALNRLSSLLDPITEVGYLVMLCVIVAAAAHWGADLATLLAATALLYRLQPHAREIEGHLLYLAQIEPQLRSVRSMLQSGDTARDDPGQQPVRTLRQAIRFEGVSFGYADDLPPALDNVSFEVPAGRTTALVGASGAGKTTLIHLLLRLYVPSAGTIRVDGVPLQDLRRTDWLGLLAVAGQDVDLIEGTVLDNIRMADAGATHERVLNAAQMAGVDEFVASLPEGYETWIGQQGHRFSGGQRQRLGLARALLRDPQLLILDEAMSALDSDLERRIRRAIDERFAGRTVLVISHRADTVRDADHVIHLHHGRVAPPAATAA
jgi:ABC-type multidrug transport system fused ATPase/permease subunit